MEFQSLKEENKIPKQFYRNRTQKVLEKWGVDGEINQFNVRNAASSYARIQIKYKIMKWVTIGSIAFLAIFLGLMIGSVVLGIEATKEFKVKDQAIVTGSKNTPLKTSEVTYSTTLSLSTPLSVVQGIKSLKYVTLTKDGQKQYLEFQVVSFYYSEKRSIILFGHTQMAKVLEDGSVEVVPINNVNGAKRFDSSLAFRSNETTTQTTTAPPPPRELPIKVSTCEQFRNISGTGRYEITNDIDCGSTFYSPLPAFGGRINGRMFTVTINIDGENGSGGIFKKLLNGAYLMRINFRGNVNGTKICGGLAAVSESGVILFTINMYSRVVCSSGSGNTRVIAGGFFGYLSTYYAQRDLIFYRCLTQGRIKVITTNPSNTYIGGLFGLASAPTFKVKFKLVTAASFFEDVVAAYLNSKRDDSSLVNQYNSNVFGLFPQTYLGPNFEEETVSKRVIDMNDDLNYVCDPDYGTQEGQAWYEQWMYAFEDIIDGYNSGNEAASQAIHDSNVALCIQYHYAHGMNDPVCCRGFGIDYGFLQACMQYFCPMTIVNPLSYPCFFCRNVKRTNGLPQVINGTLIFPENYLPDLFYPQAGCVN